jgi:mannose-6-phosphate isomerase-like protein (cupin superfamily)
MKKGAVIGNAHTGETLEMLVSEEENDGAMQLYRVRLPAHRPSPPMHYHIAFTETFTAVDGTLDLYLGPERARVQLQPGESRKVEIRQRHTFANNSGQECTMTVETRPAGGVVRAFQVAYGVANDGGAASDGLPKNPIVRLRFIAMSQGFLPGIPLPVQQIVFGIASIIARVSGIEKRVQRYIAGG